MKDRDVDKLTDIYKIVVKLSRMAQLMAEESGLVFQLEKKTIYSILHRVYTGSGAHPTS
jgi:hypothetical protein